jgi:hypothetical protein
MISSIFYSSNPRSSTPRSKRVETASGFEKDGPESQIDPGASDLGRFRHAMLPEGLGCALHDQETAVLELDRNQRAVTFAFVAKGKSPFCAKAQRANRGIFPEHLFVVAVPAHAFVAVMVQIAET